MCGYKFDETPGFYGVVRRLASYDPLKMQFGTGWLPFLNIDLIMYNRNNMDYGIITRYGHILQMLMAAGVTLGVCYGWGEGTSFDHFAAGISEASSSWLTLVSYLLGGFVSMQVAYNLRRRTYYIALLGNWKCFLCLLAGHLRPPPGDETPETAAKLSKLRETLGRYALLNFELACLAARGHGDSEEACAWCLEQGLILSRDEWGRMAKGARSHSLISWVALLMRKANDDGLLSPDSIVIFNSLLERARANSSSWLDPVLYDIPFQYVRLLTFLVKICTLLFAIRFGTKVIDPQGQRNERMIPMAVVFSAMFNCAFQGLVDLQISLYSPFNKHALSIPHESLAYKGLKGLAESLRHQAEATDLAYDGQWSDVAGASTD